MDGKSNGVVFQVWFESWNFRVEVESRKVNSIQQEIKSSNSYKQEQQ